MPTDFDYAWMATAAYNLNRNFDNKVKAPSEWKELNGLPNTNSTTGFGAAVFQHTISGEVVIAYRGTDFGPGLGQQTIIDFITGNAFLASGAFSGQLGDALDLYFRVLSRDGINASSVSFTGHSLGGGLASIMSVWANKPATVFAAAPFEAAAKNPLLMHYHWLRSPGLRGQGGMFDLSSAIINNFLAREQSVRHYYITGEFLNVPRASWNTVQGDGTQNRPIDVGATDVDMFGLHSMLLHWAATVSPEFDDIARRIPSLVERLMSPDLYSPVEITTVGRAPTSLLVGWMNDFSARSVSDQSNSLFSRFVQEALTLPTHGAASQQETQRALVVALIENYYHRNPNSSIPFLSALPNGIMIDVSQVASQERAKTQLAFDNNFFEEIGPLAYFDRSIEFLRYSFQGAGATGAASAPLTAIQTSDGVNDLIVGGVGADVLDGGGGADLLVGGAGIDNLRGGLGNDYLYGSIGNDVLNGGAGSDLLAGSEGNDRYEFRLADFSAGVIDTIFDGDGGQILMDGQLLNLGTLTRVTRTGNVWTSSTGYQLTSDASFLTIDVPGSGGQIRIRNFQQGHFGITLPEYVRPPSTRAFNAQELQQLSVLTMAAAVNGTDYSQSLTTQQAAVVSSGFEFIYQQRADESGFSATVWRNRATGEYVVAMRGEEFNPQRTDGFDKDARACNAWWRPGKMGMCGTRSWGAHASYLASNNRLTSARYDFSDPRFRTIRAQSGTVDALASAQNAYSNPARTRVIFAAGHA
jgi:hypothetical protein